MITWEYIGHQGLYTWHNGKYPNTGGQGWINSIWIDKNNPSTILAGAHNSGIWKTTDEGDNWFPITDNEPLIKGIKSIYVNPQNHNKIYISTCTLDKYSVGLFRTEDGGKTWQNIKVRLKESDTDLYPTIKKKDFPVKWIIHPENEKFMYLATWTKILRSKNRGKSWDIILDKPDYNVYMWEAGFKDLEFHPSDPSVVFVSGLEIHRISRNGNKVENLTPKILENFPGKGDIKKIVIGTQSKFPDKIWFNFYSLIKSSGYFTLASLNLVNDSVQYIGTTSIIGGAQHKMQCAISPADEGHIVLGGVRTHYYDANAEKIFYYISTSNPDSNWTHVDVRDLVFITDSTGIETIYVANDGSVFKAVSQGTGKKWKWKYLGDDGTNGIHNSELKGFDCSNTEEDVMYGGFQDMNATVFDNGTWYNILAGDGSSGLIDPENPDFIYGSYYGRKATIKRSVDRGKSFKRLITVGNKIPPLELNPLDPNIMYIGGNRKLYRFGNVRESNEYSILYDIPEIPEDDKKGYYFAGNLNIGAISICPTDTSLIYFSTSRYFPGWAKNVFQDALFKSEDGGKTWTDLSNEKAGTVSSGLNEALKRGPVTGIAINPLNQEEVWICFGSASFRHNFGLVYKSEDGGSSW
ncbi:MAG: hypothetical protein K8R53_14380, partial [Bacteroidales bacterium]|nr:hypothetical protein [Bacteroidales bacterium]